MSRTTRQEESTKKEGTLYMSLELGWSDWKLALSTEAGEKPRLRNVKARDLAGLMAEIDRAKDRFHLRGSAAVKSCYEAGRDGFWLHRYLLSQGIDNRVVDSSSIEVNRRARQAKSDGLDAVKLLELLLREARGERVWSVVRVPSPQAEDERHLSRELEALKGERTQHSNRIRGLLASQGLEVRVGKDLRQQLESARLWDGSPIGRDLLARLYRECDRLELVSEQIQKLEAYRREQLAKPTTEAVEKARQLRQLKGIGDNSSWLFVAEFFSWRQFRNRREVSALAGLAPTPYQSGQLSSEQGISRAGNVRVRSMAIEIAWGWLRFQPRSQLSQWYWQRFGSGNSRSRRIGIVALARKLLVSLWRYLQSGVLPEGAELKG